MSHFCSSFPWCIPFSGFPTNEWQRIDSSKDLQSCKYLKSVGFRKDYISHHYYCFLFKNCSFYLVWSKYGAQTPAKIVFLQTGIKYSGGFRNQETMQHIKAPLLPAIFGFMNFIKRSRGIIPTMEKNKLFIILKNNQC